ncbi:MAG: GDP-mannose 4,6-dehydratase [Thermoplasmata archaeon]
MKVLIMGASGFIGSHLASHLISRGHEVWGTWFSERERTALEGMGGRVRLVRCDVRKRNEVERVLRRCRPERVYHLAAQSFPTVSWRRPALTITTNVIGTINLFEAIKGLGRGGRELNARVLIAGSSAVYGLVNEDEVPVREDHPLRPLHPYGVSKAAQEMLGYQYFKNFGIWSATARIFNTTGPGKVSDVCADFASQIARIEAGLQRGPMRVGNLSARRDITDVRDQVRGLEAVIERGEPGEAYNLSTGRAVRIRDILEHLISLSTVKIEYRVDPALLRPTDEPVIMGDSSKVRRATGWRPRIPLRKTLQDTLDFWRRRVASRAPGPQSA